MKHVLAGELIETTFIKNVKASHYMKVLDGYGISESAFQELLEKGCETVLIKTPTDTWKAGIGQWVKLGKVADYNSGKQRFLSLKYMRKVQRKTIINGNTATISYE